MTNGDDIDSDYADVCSAKTIFSDGQGFFGEMFECVKNACPKKTKWIENTFNGTHSDADKLKLLFNEPNVCDMLLGTLEHVMPVYRKKDSTFSHCRRKDGEKLRNQKDFANALLMMTQAVLRAPAKGIDIRNDGGLTLALALWSRSAVLLELNRGANALVDLQCAIDNGLESVKKQPEYYARLAKANAMIGDKCKTQICMNLAKSFFGGDADQYRALEIVVNQIKSVASAKKIEAPTLSDGEHKTLRGASKKMEIKTMPECGNFTVASERIDAGDVLVVENPIAACLLPKYFGSHCLHCLRRIEIGYACPNCAGVAFCSIDCQKQACSTYHKFECKFMDLLIGSGMSILCFIALRIITQYENVDNAIREGHRIISALCTHSNERKATDYLQRSVMSAFLLRILQRADYFGRRTSESAYPNSDAEYQIGEILIGLLQVLQFNAHEIYDTKTTENEQFMKGEKILYIGAAIYNSAAYFNHSCYPAVVRYFVGTKIVLCAARPLESGEVVAENYGPIFTKHTLRERQHKLQSRYWFKCTCIACVENWPTLKQLDNRARIRCPTPNCINVHISPKNVNHLVKCSKCKKLVNLQLQIATLIKSEELYRMGAEFMANKQLHEAARAFVNGINLFYTVAMPPHQDTHIAQDSLRVCLTNIGRI